MVSVRRFDGEGAFKAGVEKSTGKPIKQSPKPTRDHVQHMHAGYVSTAPVSLPRVPFQDRGVSEVNSKEGAR